MAPYRLLLAALFLLLALRPSIAEEPAGIPPDIVIDPRDDVAAGTRRPRPAPPVVHVSFSADGRTLLCGHAGGRIDVRDAATGARLRSFFAPCLALLAVVQTEDGRILAATWGAHRVRVRELTTQDIVLDYLQEDRPDFGAISADGSVFACDSRLKIRMFDLSMDEELPAIAVRRIVMNPERFHPDLPGGSEEDLLDDYHWGALSPDGTALLSDFYKGSTLWDTGSGRAVVLGLRREAVAGAASGDLSCFLIQYKWKELTLLYAGESEPFPIPAPGLQSCVRLAFSPPGRVAAGAGFSADVGIFDTWTRTTFALLACPEALALAFSPDGGRIATGHGGGSVRVWNLPAPPPARARRPESTENLWGILACDSPMRVREATFALASRGDEALGVLRESFAERPKEDTILFLSNQLASEDAGTRQSAREELEWWGVLAEPGLRRALAGELPEAARRGAEEVLDLAESRLSRSRVNRQRSAGLRVLESMGSAGALDVLQRVADESPSPRERADANAAVLRLRMRAAGGGK